MFSLVFDLLNKYFNQFYVFLYIHDFVYFLKEKRKINEYT